MSIVTMNVASFVQHFKWELAPKEIEHLNFKIKDVMYFHIHNLIFLSSGVNGSWLWKKILLSTYKSEYILMSLEKNQCPRIFLGYRFLLRT